MTKRIMQHLTDNNSYFKWSTTRLAKKYKCSKATMTEIMNKLSKVKSRYLKSLKD